MDKRLRDSIQEATLETDMENLKLSRHEWMCDSSPSPLGNDENISLNVYNIFFLLIL